MEIFSFFFKQESLFLGNICEEKKYKMGNSNWNPFKKERHEKEKKEPEWDFDPRAENFYLGRVNENGDNDLKLAYFSDGHSDRYYRRSELEPPKIQPPAEPFKNNAHEGNRKRKWFRGNE